MAVCPSCKGTGNGSSTCFQCKGTGLGNMNGKPTNTPCTACKGRRFSVCPTCKGTGQK